MKVCGITKEQRSADSQLVSVPPSPKQTRGQVPVGPNLYTKHANMCSNFRDVAYKMTKSLRTRAPPNKNSQISRQSCRKTNWRNGPRRHQSSELGLILVSDIGKKKKEKEAAQAAQAAIFLDGVQGAFTTLPFFTKFLRALKNKCLSSAPWGGKRGEALASIANMHRPGFIRPAELVFLCTSCFKQNERCTTST